MKRIISVFLAVVTVISLISLLAACSEKETKKFYEERYTELGYDEYFSEIRPVVNAVTTEGQTAGFFENYGVKLSIYEKFENNCEEEEDALYLSGEEKTLILDNIKANVSLGREVLCLSGNGIWSVDRETGEKELLYQSEKEISKFFGSTDIIAFISENTVFRLFRPTSAVDEIFVLDEKFENGNFAVCGNNLFLYGGNNPAYTEIIDKNGGIGEVICWDFLIERYGDEVSKLKKTYEEEGVVPDIIDVLDKLDIEINLIYIYNSADKKTYEVHEFNGDYYSDCPERAVWESVAEAEYA